MGIIVLQSKRMAAPSMAPMATGHDAGRRLSAAAAAAPVLGSADGATVTVTAVADPEAVRLAVVELAVLAADIADKEELSAAVVVVAETLPALRKSPKREQMLSYPGFNAGYFSLA